MADDPKEKLRRSINALERVHAVIMAFGLTLAARTFLEPWLMVSGGTIDVPFPTDSFLLFVALFVTVVPFFHGATRHMDKAYLHSATPPKRLALLVDYTWLYVEGIIFIALGMAARSADHFILVAGYLMLADSLWAATTYFFDRSTQRYIIPWLGLNVATVMALSFLVFVAEGTVPLAIAVGALVRTVADYWMNWDLFFDVPQASGAATAEPVEA